MLNRIDVALAILMLVRAALAVMGRPLLGMLAWGERLQLAMRVHRAMSVRPGRSTSDCPTRPPHSAGRRRATESNDGRAQKRHGLTR
jgi:hypothetical protein